MFISVRTQNVVRVRALAHGRAFILGWAVSMYRESECLWNPLCEEYKDMKIKNNTWKDFADHFDKDVGEVKKKIKNLRTCYVLEKKKCEKAAREFGKKSRYEPRLFYYDEMTFLDPVIVLRILNITEQVGYPLNERSSTRSQNAKAMDRAEKNDPITEKNPKRSLKTAEEPPEKIRRFDYEDSVEEQLPIRESTPTILRNDANTTPIDRCTPHMGMTSEDPVDSSKEQTFCAMLCSELKLLNSEDIYDNVTSEIFTLVKNAKVAERQIVYQPEEDTKFAMRGT